MSDLVKNIHRGEEYDVYIGRPSEWGNPYSHLPGNHAIRCKTREEAIEWYRKGLWARLEGNPDPEYLRRLAELDGKRLGCFCAPAACHGEVLVKAAKWAKEQVQKGEGNEVR